MYLYKFGGWVGTGAGLRGCQRGDSPKFEGPYKRTVIAACWQAKFYLPLQAAAPG